MDEQQRLRDWLAQPRTAAECRAELPLLAWLGRVLDGAPAAKLMPVATALAGTDTALDGALFVGLEKASDGDPDVLLLSASMRQSVAKQHLEVARRNLRQRKFEAVGAAVVSAREVARPGSAILEPLAEVEEALTNELDRQAEALQRATTLKDAFKRWKDVLVLARARSGGAPNPIESIATDAFTAFASDEPEAGLTGLDKLKGSQEVHVLRAREVLVTQAAAWLRPRLARLAKDRNFTASEQILVTLQELRPQDAELTAQLAGVRELAYLQRSERIHQAVRHGHLALGYVLIAKDTALTEADRDALKQRYSAELAQVNQRVLIGGEIVHDGARELAGTSVSGKGWALGPGVASMANRPYFPTTLLLRAAAVRVSEPRQTARRSKTARVRDGVERSENPEKEACAEQIGDAEQDLSRAEAAFAVAETANRECQRAAAASKAPYASIACSGGTVATKIALESIRSKLSNTRSRCSGLPEYVESERWSEREYEVVEWRVEGSAEVELAMLDPSSPAEFGMRRVRAETSATDSSAEAPADLKNVQDELELPSREVLERRLLDDLRRKYEAVCAALVGDYLRMLDDRGEALTGTVRLEVLARLLLLHGKSGINTPKKDSWLRELLASAPVQAGDAEALRRHDAAASRTVASRTVAPGPVVAPAPSTSRQADAADALVASVLAGESSGPTSCGECSDFCAPKARACLAGDSDACLAAAVCTCRCKLSQGGCGEEVAALRRCEAQGGGKPRKAARGKPAP
jgi:hypothetical protein